MKRNLTAREEHAFRLVHQSFRGLQKQSAANIMNITVGRFNQILRSVRTKAPQLFPILTKRQHQVSELLDGGIRRCGIARILGLTLKQVDSTIAQLHKLGVYEYHRPKTVQYEPSMDGKVKRQF